MTLEDALNEGEKQEQPAASPRRTAVVQAPPGYRVVDCWVAVVADELVTSPPEGFHVPDYRVALKKMVDSRFKGSVIISEDESRTRAKGDTPREHVAWTLFIDTPASARKREQANGRPVKPPTESDVPKLLKEVGALMLNDELIAEAQQKGASPKVLARVRVAEKHGITVEQLQELTKTFLMAA